MNCIISALLLNCLADFLYISVYFGTVLLAKRSFSLSFKKEAIAFSETTNSRKAVTKFNVDIKRIREWRQNKADIIKTCAKAKAWGKESKH